MKICDRCKKKIDNNRENVIAGEKFELCDYCAEYIANHIKNYKQKKSVLQNFLGR